jgi:predicted nucleic acid-binding Zn ribbon protein
MPTHTPTATPSEKAERAAVAPFCDRLPGQPRPLCPICGTPMEGRRTSACSDRCRAALSRRRRLEAQATKETRLRELVKVLAKQAGLTAEDLA